MALPSALMGKPTTAATRVSGKIRPGIMILTKKGQENADAAALYAKGVAAAKSFEDVAAEIQKRFGESLMRPVNVPYFTVRRGDFAMPEVADLILERFGEQREDGVRRLYRFPVVFATDELTHILDFRFQCFTSAGLKFWSDEYNGARVCRMFAPLLRDPKTQRAVRVPAGREVVARAENGGSCEPRGCAEFQAGECKMRGRILFYIPGIPGAGMFEIPTGSKNFGFDSETTLREIARVTGGRLRGLAGDKPVFWLTKKLRREIPMIDYAKGTTGRTDQWIIEIEADLDMSRLVAQGVAGALAAPGPAAAAALQGPAPSVPAPLVSTGEAGAGAPAAPRSSALPAPTGTGSPPEVASPRSPEVDPPGRAQVKALRQQVHAALKQAGIASEAFSSYALRSFGEGWSIQPASLELALGALAQVVKLRGAVRDSLVGLDLAAADFDSYAAAKWGESWNIDPDHLRAVVAELMAAFEEPAVYRQATLDAAKRAA